MKNPLLIVSLALLLCFAFACQNRAERGELEKFRAQAKVEEQNKELVKRGFEALNEGDFDAIKEMTAPKFVRYIPSNSIDIRSPEERVAFAKALHTAFPDVNFSIEELYADEDRVIYRLIKYEISGIGIWRIGNGKVVEVREELDRLGRYQQLGMELKPKEPEKK